MKSITAYQILAVLAIASGVLAAPVGITKQEVSDDPHKAEMNGTPAGQVDRLVLGQHPYADAMHGAMGELAVGHIPGRRSMNAVLDAVKVTINPRSPVSEPVEADNSYIRNGAEQDTGCYNPPPPSKRNPQDDDGSYDDEDADDADDDDSEDWQKRYTPESLIKVHVLADHSTSGKDGVVNAGTDKGQNLHLVQTPGKDENIAHLRISPPGSPEKANLYVNAPSDTDGHRIPPGGIAKTAAKAGKTVAAVTNKTPAKGATGTVKQAAEVVDASPIAQAYVGGPFLNDRDLTEPRLDEKRDLTKVIPKVGAKVKVGKRANPVNTLKLPVGALPKSLVPCDGKSHGKTDVVDACIDARLLSVAPKGTGPCPDKDNHEVDPDVLVKSGSIVRLCVDAGAA